MLTYQDYLNTSEYNKVEFIQKLIREHTQSDIYQTAKTADNYDRQLNETIFNYTKMIYTLTGEPVKDFTAANNKIASNFFHRLNTQRNTYLLGNGVAFAEYEEVEGENTKEKLGQEFDTDLKNAGYLSLIHGITFGFWNLDKLHIFPVTEFAPLWDEETGELKAGVRFWRLDETKPIYAVFYEEDGYTKLRSKTETDKTDRGADKGFSLEIIQEKKSYKYTVQTSEVDGDEIIGEDNYGRLPIVPLYGSKLKQSTLVGMQRAIDSYDLIRSGFANDLTDCAQIYWILENAVGMSDAELARFRDRIKLNHIATIDADNSKVVPYTQEIPFQARKEYLEAIRAGIYEDFGGLDVHTVAAGATNDHIDAAYQPMDEEADDFEYQIIQFVQQILKLIGIEDTPTFKRNRISNQAEQTDMILQCADYLDEETILTKLPFITVDEVQSILEKKDLEDMDKFGSEEVPLGEEDEEDVDVDGELDGLDSQLDELLAELGEE